MTQHSREINPVLHYIKIAQVLSSQEIPRFQKKKRKKGQNAEGPTYATLFISNFGSASASHVYPQKSFGSIAIREQY